MKSSNKNCICDGLRFEYSKNMYLQHMKLIVNLVFLLDYFNLDIVITYIYIYLKISLYCKMKKSDKNYIVLYS